MKIFVTSGTYTTIGGGGFIPFLFSRLLADTGHDVTAFTGIAHDISPEYPPHPRIKIVLPAIRRGCRLALPEMALVAQIHRAIRRERPDFVFNVGVTSLTRRLLKGHYSARIVVWENINADPRNHLIDAKAAALVHRCRSMLAPSPRIVDLIRTGYGYQGRIDILPFWVEETPPQGRHRPELLSDFTILARKDPDKGQIEAIRALAELKRAENKRPRVFMAGQGPDDWIRRAAEEHGVLDQIRLGFLKTRQDVMDALASTRCLLLPSYSEGYPLVILEALAQGTPVIATDVGGVMDMIGGVEGCCAIPARSVPSLIEAMRSRLTATTSDIPDTARRALQSRFREINNLAAIRGQLARIIEALSSSRPGRSPP